MENQKNNKGLIASLVVIIVILSALCILFATGTISLKSNDVDNNEPNPDINENNNKNDLENDNSDINNNDNVTDDTTKNTETTDNDDTNNKEEDNANENIKDETNCNSNENFTINEDELSRFGKADYNIIKDVYNGNFSFKLEVNGRINIKFENYISNISNAKDIVLLDSTLYILTKDGDVYKYETSKYQSKDYKATKIDTYSHITQMIHYMTRKAYAGGCDNIILVDKNGNYFRIDSHCV